MSALAATLRPIRPDDMQFLFEVYASTRLEELAPLSWSAEQQRGVFWRKQFEAQHHYYQANYSDTTYNVILLKKLPIGRLYVARWDDEIRIVDIALLPQYRKRGIGTYLLNALLAEGARRGKPVRIHVEKFNPALHLYKRLGFSILEDRGVYWLMERQTGRVAVTDDG